MKRAAVFRQSIAWAGLAGLFAAQCLAQGVHRNVDEKGKVTYSDVPQERRAAAARPAEAPAQPAQPRPGEAAPRYHPNGPVVDYTGRYSETAPYGFKSSGRETRSYAGQKTLDERIAEQNQRVDQTRQREQQMRENAEQRDRDRVQREARARLEADKRRLRELQAENDRR